MKLKWYGHSCFGMTFSDGTCLITDPFDDTVGYPLCTARADVVLTSHDHFDHNHVASLEGNPTVIRTDGEHRFGTLRITGIHTWHDPEGGKLRGPNIVYRVEGDGLTLIHLGDLGHRPDDALIDAISGADVMLLPIGGTFTITTPEAVDIIRRARPRCAVAMHFANAYCHFPVTDEREFVERTGAKEMPGEIEILPDTDLPRAIVMRYE